MGGGYTNKQSKTTKFETLNNKGIYKKLALLFVAVFLVASVYFKTSSAKYKVTQEVQIVNGNIKANLADLNTVAIYVKEQETGEYVQAENNQVPTGNYEIDEENTKCTVNGDKVEGITFEYKDGKIGVYGISQGKTKCNIFLNKITTPTDAIKDQVIADAIQPDFSHTSCLNGTNSETHDSGDCQEQTNGVYVQETNNGTTYYFRGSVNNNWVKFGKMGIEDSGNDIWWRIIRINEDGTVRLIYAGEATDLDQNGYYMIQQFGIDRYDYAEFNQNKYNQNAYVGYMYGTPGSDNYNSEHGYDLIDQGRQNELQSSTAKTDIDDWYVINLTDEGYMLSGSTGFCGDRSIADYKPNGFTNEGFGKEKTYYKAYDRVSIKYEPSYDCPNEKHDLYTTKDEQGKGNGALDYPIGIATADEIVYAGGKYQNINYGYWLNPGQCNLILSSAYKESGTRVFSVNYNGSIIVRGTNEYSSGIYTSYRPVVNLKPEYFKTQDENGNTLDGTIESPYIASAT